MKKINIIFALFFLCTLSFAGSESAEVQTPWSGYWWPIKQGTLITGKDYKHDPSTFYKYDKVFNLFGSTLKWELENHYDPEGASWWGHCNGWACASILAPEPSGTFSMNHITFYTGDVKGLLTAYYQSGTGTLYGNRYDDENDDFSDMNPLLFQEKIQEFIRDNQLPILMDNDPGIEIWTYPIYKYNLEWNDVGNTRHVTATVYYPTDFVTPDFIGSKIRSDVYTYDLTLVNNEPVDGEWTGDSVDAHPDFLWYPDIVEYHGTNNPYVTLENIQTITNSSYNLNKDDSFENNDQIEDSFLLETNEVGRSLDKDFFNLSVEPGEEFVLNYKDNSDTNHYNWLNLYDQAGNKVETYSKKSDNFINYGYIFLNFSATSFENYFISIVQQINPSEKFEDNYKFSIELSSKYSIFPHTINDPYWTTLYLAGYIPAIEESATAKITPSGFDQLSIFDKNVINVSDDLVTPNTFKQISIVNTGTFPEWVKLNSLTDSFRTFSFFMSGGEGSMAFLSESTPALDFILPHIPNETEFWWYGLLILNPNRFSSANLQYTIMFNNELAEQKGSITLKGYEKKVGLFEDFFPEIDMSTVSYIKFSSDSPVIASSLYGTLNHKELSYVPVSTSGFTQNQSFYIPCTLLNEENSWQGAVFINQGENSTSLRFNVTKKDNSSVSFDLPLAPGEKWVGEIKNILPEGTTYDTCQLIKGTVLSSNAEIVGFTMFGNHNEGKLTSFPFLTYNNDYEIIFPFINNNLIKSNLLLINENNFNLSESVIVQALNNQGETIETVYLPLQAYEKSDLDLENIFTSESISNMNSIRVKSSHFIISTIKIYSEDGKYFEIIPPTFN